MPCHWSLTMRGSIRTVCGSETADQDASAGGTSGAVPLSIRWNCQPTLNGTSVADAGEAAAIRSPSRAAARRAIKSAKPFMAGQSPQHFCVQRAPLQRLEIRIEMRAAAHAHGYSRHRRMGQAEAQCEVWERMT